MPRPAELDYERITGSEEMQADARMEAAARERDAEAKREHDAFSLATRSQQLVDRCKGYILAYGQTHPERAHHMEAMAKEIDTLIVDLQAFRKQSALYNGRAA